MQELPDLSLDVPDAAQRLQLAADLLAFEQVEPGRTRIRVVPTDSGRLGSESCPSRSEYPRDITDLCVPFRPLSRSPKTAFESFR